MPYHSVYLNSHGKIGIIFFFSQKIPFSGSSLFKNPPLLLTVVPICVTFSMCVCFLHDCVLIDLLGICRKALLVSYRLKVVTDGVNPLGCVLLH